jgi:hypothetical protein
MNLEYFKRIKQLMIPFSQFKKKMLPIILSSKKQSPLLKEFSAQLEMGQ